MKKIVLLFMLLIFSAVAYSQSSGITLTPEQISKLDPATKASIVALQAEQKTDQIISTGSKWVGLGKEIAEAVNESAKGVALTASEFAETKLGKYTMFLIAYKVLGGDFLRVIIGLIFIPIVLLITWRLYRTNSERRVLISRTWKSEGKGWETKYEVLRGDDDFKVAATVIMVLGLIVCLLVIIL
jgi:hypothetical protein